MNDLITANALNNRNPDWRKGFNKNQSVWATIGDSSTLNISVPEGMGIARFYSTSPIIVSESMLPAPPIAGTSITGTFECNPGVMLLERSISILYLYAFIESSVVVNFSRR